jgi:predicted N-acetyltransferase YhbS
MGNVRKERQGQGIGHALTDHCLREVMRADGWAIHLMTKRPSFFERWGFVIVRDYRREGCALMSIIL